MNKIFSGFDLKIIGIIFMVIDHVNTYLGQYLGLPAWVSLLGRFVAPLFVFLMIEGYYHTKNKTKYFLRLFSGGVLMYVINITYNLLTKTNFNNPFTGQFDFFLVLQGQNIFMTLALLLAFIWLLDKIKTNHLSNSQRLIFISSMIILLPCILMSEGGIYELVMALIFYLFRGNLRNITLSVVGFTGILFVHTLYNYLTIPDMGSFYQVITFSNEFMMVTVLPFIYLYNGKRGGKGNKWEKNLFYYFYPLHLILIYILKDVAMNFFS